MSGELDSFIDISLNVNYVEHTTAELIYLQNFRFREINRMEIDSYHVQKFLGKLMHHKQDLPRISYIIRVLIKWGCTVSAAAEEVNVIGRLRDKTGVGLSLSSENLRLFLISGPRLIE